MPYLGDYLGQLVSEITLARMQSDLEAIRLAELYSSHPLLKHMPVPRMRIPELTLDIPVLVAESEPARPDESVRGGGGNKPLRERFEQLLNDHLQAGEVSLTAAERRALRSELDSRLASQAAVPETAVDVFPLADQLTSAASTFLAKRAQAAGRPDEVLSDAALNSLKHAARLEFLKLRSAPPRLSVLVTESELRERATDQNVIRLRVSVNEDAVQWTSIEMGGVTQDRLLPE